MDDVRALLDSLMGQDRDAGKNGKKQSFKDDHVCKHFLVGTCPHDFFVNHHDGKVHSKSPLGACSKQHLEVMKDRLRQDADHEKYTRRYQEDLHAMLTKLVSENDAKQTREIVNEHAKNARELVDGEIEAREMLIKEKMQAAERYAEEGDVDLSKETMKDAEALAEKNRRFAKMRDSSGKWLDEFCTVCGQCISWRTPEEIKARDHGRDHPHVMGSVHQGWKKLREEFARLDSIVKAFAKDDAGRERGRDRSRERDTRRENGRNRQKKSPEQDRRRERERSSGRDRGRHDRDRSRRNRSRSRRR
eukprot:TRINITY_DN86076_c0_g1_i1.p1 TRINITY_DN86076_c0_g1~~TRINITY_DN86076_c0_g1_i1.p1  ORF type:complete len:304 (-),score=73.51 TRINITY_DN86076_c0_g1_i1:358-1269(-)